MLLLQPNTMGPLQGEMNSGLWTAEHFMKTQHFSQTLNCEWGLDTWRDGGTDGAQEPQVQVVGRELGCLGRGTTASRSFQLKYDVNEAEECKTTAVMDCGSIIESLECLTKKMFEFILQEMTTQQTFQSRAGEVMSVNEIISELQVLICKCTSPPNPILLQGVRTRALGHGQCSLASLLLGNRTVVQFLLEEYVYQKHLTHDISSPCQGQTGN